MPRPRHSRFNDVLTGAVLMLGAYDLTHDRPLTGLFCLGASALYFWLSRD